MKKTLLIILMLGICTSLSFGRESAPWTGKWQTWSVVYDSQNGTPNTQEGINYWADMDSQFSIVGEPEPGYEKVLSISTDLVLNPDWCFFYQDNTPSVLPPPRWMSADNNKGWIVEAQLKVKTSGTTTGQQIVLSDERYVVILDVTTSSMFIASTYLQEGTFTYECDLKSNYNTIKITAQDRYIKIYLNEVLIHTGTLIHPSTQKFILFGDTSDGANSGGNVYWRYFKYKV